MQMAKTYTQSTLKLRDFSMAIYKFKSNIAIDKEIKTLLAGSKFSSFQDYVEWRIGVDLKSIQKGKALS